MNLPTQSQYISFGRHVISYAMGGITMFAALHLISGGDATNLTSALNQLSHGAAEVITALGTIIATVSGIYAAWSASPLSQLLAVAKQAADPSSPVKGVIVQNTPAGLDAAVAAPGIVPEGTTQAAAIAKAA